jgi:hypothetical protein
MVTAMPQAKPTVTACGTWRTSEPWRESPTSTVNTPEMMTATMTDADIVEMYSDVLDAQWGLSEGWDNTVLEEPPGEKQIDYHENSDQWVPRGDVLRCIIDDGGLNGEVIIHIDDQELSLAEFGRLLSVHAGWGMRIAFVPEEFITESPTVKMRKPQRRKRRAKG